MKKRTPWYLPVDRNNYTDEPMPKTRGDCVNGPRPCPWRRCRFHLDPDRSRFFNIKATDTCALDLADRGGMTLDEVGNALGITRERVRQIEAKALKQLTDDGLLDDDE